MRKDRKLLASGSIAIVTGILSAGFGFTTTLGHPISTICFIGGLALIIIGIILFILGANTKSYEE